MITERAYSYETSPRKYYDYASMEETPVKSIRKESLISANDRATLLKTIFGIAVLLIFMLCITAYISQITYTISDKSKQITAMQSEIDSLKLDLKRQSTIKVIESRATAELGMIYPDVNQMVFLEGIHGASNTYASK